MNDRNTIRSTARPGARWLGKKRRMGGMKVAMALYTLYLAVILTTAAGHLMAAVTIDEAEQEYRYDLRFRDDGRTGHYTVELNDSRLPGTVDVLYEKEENALTLSVRNMKNITVHTKDLFQDEGDTIMGVDPAENEEYYREYFIQRNLFTINLETSQRMDMVVIEDIGRPDTAYVNGELMEEANTTVSYEGGDVVILDVPAGMTEVEIYYDDEEGLRPPGGEGSGEGAFSGQTQSALIIVVAIIAVLCVVWWLLVVKSRSSGSATAAKQDGLDEWEEWDDAGGWKTAGRKAHGRSSGKVRPDKAGAGGRTALRGDGMGHTKGPKRGGRDAAKGTGKVAKGVSKRARKGDGGPSKIRGKKTRKGKARNHEIKVKWDDGDGGDPKVSWDDEGGAEPTVQWDD